MRRHPAANDTPADILAGRFPLGVAPRNLRYIRVSSLDRLPQLDALTRGERFALRVVAEVFPFRTNNYVVEELIDWRRGSGDPLLRLHFPHREMLEEDEFDLMAGALRRGAPPAERQAIAHGIRLSKNPQPAGQLTENVPTLYGRPVPGVQHKYRETVLVFPSAGQRCHAYCTYCFRWAQFVDPSLPKLSTGRDRTYLDYVRVHPEVTDVLFTGGDPMTMAARRLASFVEPLLAPEFAHIQTVRIGTKAVAHWPYRFVCDRDADEVLRLFERVVKAGKHLALMGHYSHGRELSTDVAREAVRRIRGTGAEVRTQCPVLRGINDDPDTWRGMWREQVRLGCVPYYLFVARNTGAERCFSVTLGRTLDICRGAVQGLSGLGRTARGPVMSATPGKVQVLGISRLLGRRAFVLTMLESRVPEQVGRPFFAEYDPQATWLTDLRPALGADPFPFHARSRVRVSTGRADREPRIRRGRLPVSRHPCQFRF